MCNCIQSFVQTNRNLINKKFGSIQLPCVFCQGIHFPCLWLLHYICACTSVDICIFFNYIYFYEFLCFMYPSLIWKEKYHTQRNLFKSNWNQSENCKYDLISIWFNRISKRFFYVYQRPIVTVWMLSNRVFQQTSFAIILSIEIH